MTVLGAFPNVKQVLVDVLTALAPVSTSVPAGYDGSVPRLRIRVYGGLSDQISDSPRFDVDAFSTSEQTADALAEQVRQLLISGPHVTAHGVLDSVITETRPNTVPYSDLVFNTTAAYRGALRRS